MFRRATCALSSSTLTVSCELSLPLWGQHPPNHPRATSPQDAPGDVLVHEQIFLLDCPSGKKVRATVNDPPCAWADQSDGQVSNSSRTSFWRATSESRRDSRRDMLRMCPPPNRPRALLLVVSVGEERSGPTFSDAMRPLFSDSPGCGPVTTTCASLRPSLGIFERFTGTFASVGVGVGVGVRRCSAFAAPQRVRDPGCSPFQLVFLLPPNV
jgi:hypothetical protein